MWFPLQPHSTTCYIVGTRDDLTKHCTHHRFVRPSRILQLLFPRERVGSIIKCYLIDQLSRFCSRASHVRSVPTITYDHDPCLPFRNSRLCLAPDEVCPFFRYHYCQMLSSTRTAIPLSMCFFCHVVPLQRALITPQRICSLGHWREFKSSLDKTISVRSRTIGLSSITAELPTC